MTDNNTVIKVKHVSKSFLIPHERISSLRDGVFSVFRPKQYEKFDALKDVSFEVKRGEFLGIIGRNGSGKSTLLKILAGIYRPDSGSVEINGKISPFLELGVGFNGELTARENVFLNGTILGLSEKQIVEKFEKIIEFAELEKFVDTKVKNFSSGMYARLAFSVAIEADADIYLMDEVLAVGDANFQTKCFAKFEGLKKRGNTIILISHDLNTIQKYTDCVIFISNGEIEKEGDPKTTTQLYIKANIQ